MDTRGCIFDIQRCSLHDGGGIRTLVFLKGCPLRCPWCCNPESQETVPEVLFSHSRCLDCGSCYRVCPSGGLIPNASADRPRCEGCGACARVCPTGARVNVGRWVSVPEIVQVVERDRPFYRASGGGVTISGGEPLLQSGFVAELLQACQSHELHTALETCGHATWENLACVLAHTDTVLFDVKHLDSAIHRRATGVGNELILGNLERAAACGAQIVLRLPLIPGFNADPVMVRRVADLAGRLAIRELHLLPYHRLGESKCEALGRTTAPHIPLSLLCDEVERLRDIAAVVPGVRVQIGG